MTETRGSFELFRGIDLSRRAFLTTSVLSLGSIACASIAEHAGLDEKREGPVPPDREAALKAALGTATAKRVILIFAAGGLSQLDLFDEKPVLNQRRGEELPDSVRKGQRITGVTEKQGALP